MIGGISVNQERERELIVDKKNVYIDPDAFGKWFWEDIIKHVLSWKKLMLWIEITILLKKENLIFDNLIII